MLNSQNFGKYEFFTDFLVEIFDLRDENLNLPFQTKNKVLKPNIEKLSKELQNSWIHLLQNCIYFPSIQKEYLEKFLPWRVKFNAFKQVKTEQDLLIYLEEYFSTWMKLSFKSKDITKGEIYDILEHERPTISSITKQQFGSYRSFSILKNDNLQLTLHLKLKIYKTNTLSILILFSIWFNDTKKFWSASLDQINENYKNLIVSYDIVQKLKSLKYQENFLDFEDKSTSNRFLVSTYTRSSDSIHPSNNLILELLSDNPVSIFEEIISHLYIIDDIIQNYNKNQDISPYTYFENLSLELQQFLLKGKELFLKTEEILQHQSKPKLQKEGVERIKESEELKITFEQIIAFFKDALEQDRTDEAIPTENKGFRTQNQIYDEYKSRIRISKPTFYNYFESLKLESYLEIRTKSGKGGGKKLRYKEKPFKAEDILEDIGDQEVKTGKNLFSERIEIQEALSYYNIRDYEICIQIFKHVLASKEIHSDKNLYCTCLYYLGRSFFKSGNYKKALANFYKAHMKNLSLYNVKYALVESHLYLYNYEDALKLVDDIISGIKDIIQTNNINLNLDYLFIGEIDLDSIKIIHPRIANEDMLSKYLILINKPQLRIGPFSPSNLTLETYDIINNNIVSLQILYKKYLSSAYLKLEILRRLFFRAVLKKEESQIEEIGDVFLQYSKDLYKDTILNNAIPIEDYENYVSYFRGLSKLFKLYKIGEKIALEFPNVGKLASYPRNYYLHKFGEYYTCINYLNEIFYDDLKKRDRIFKLFKLKVRYPKIGKVSDPILQAEYYFVGAYANLNYLIDNRIKSEEESNLNFDVSTINNLEEVFMKVDDFHSRWLGNRHPIFFIETAKKAYNYSKKHKFDYLIKWTKNFLKETREKYEIIEKLRLKRRIQIINRKLEILSKNYKETNENIPLSFQMEPKEGFRHFVQIRLKRDLERILREKYGNVTFTIQLFNPELNRDVMEAIMNETFYRDAAKNRPQSYFMIKINAEENEFDDSFSLKLTHMRDFERESGGFSENLDKITWVIYNAINLNLNSFRIKIDPARIEQYQNYFENEFEIEYENKYFEFKVAENVNEEEFIIQIKKL